MVAVAHGDGYRFDVRLQGDAATASSTSDRSDSEEDDISARTKPPFRADHVGSLLRPARLLQARDDHAAGRIDADELRRIEDESIARSCASRRRSACARRPTASSAAPPGTWTSSTSSTAITKEAGHIAVTFHQLSPPHRVHACRLSFFFFFFFFFFTFFFFFFLSSLIYQLDHHEGSRPHRGHVPQRGRRHRVHAGRAARRREARRLEDDLRRRLPLPPGHGHDEPAEADDPLAEHGPLPRRQGGRRPGRLPDARRVLGRPDRRLPGARCAGSASSAAPTCSSTTRASPT